MLIKEDVSGEVCEGCGVWVKLRLWRRDLYRFLKLFLKFHWWCEVNHGCLKASPVCFLVRNFVSVDLLSLRYRNGIHVS
jgi:hypothetical protein